MIAFWESESEGRKVFYQSITGEDTGEVVLEVSTRINIAHLDLRYHQVRAATLWLIWTAQLLL